MCRKLLVISLLLILFLSTFLVQDKPTTTGSSIVMSGNPETNSVIVINQTEYTWYGDFIVNAGDTVVIENCNFTVVNGEITVYGTMEARNSTIWMRHAFRKTKIVYVHGNFTMLHSQLLNENRIYCRENSHVFILNSSSPTTPCYNRGGEIEVRNSVLALLMNWPEGGSIFVMNSTLVRACVFTSYRSASFVAIESYIPEMVLQLEFYTGNLEIRNGLVENLTIYFESQSANYTLINSYVAAWHMICDSIYNVKLSNSIVDILGLTIVGWSGSLTLIPGLVEYQEMAFPRDQIIIENSTIGGWEVVATDSDIQILNSRNISIYMSGNFEIYIQDSEVREFYITDYGLEFGVPPSLLTRNTTIGFAYISLPFVSLNITLKEGFHDFFNIYISEYEANMTFIDSTIERWSFTVSHGPFTLSNSTLAEPLDRYMYNLRISSGYCFVYSSSLGSVCCSWSSSLTLVNSMVDKLYAYGDSTIIAINSTINMLITDPIQVELTNSTILLEIDFSFEMTAEDAITLSSSEECDPVLPEAIQRFSRYTNITTLYNDYFEAQVRIYYSETKVEEAGKNENLLRMYYLSEPNSWQLCPIQGVNTVENYVWANVTHFSCFVLGVTKIGDLGGGLPPEFFSFDNIVDGKDLALFLQCYKGTASPEAMYIADLGGGVPPSFFNCDDKVDGKDLALFLLCYKGLGP